MVKVLLKGNLVREPNPVKGGYIITLACNISDSVTFFANIYATDKQISEKLLPHLTKGKNILVECTLRNDKKDSNKSNFYLEKIYF